MISCTEADALLDPGGRYDGWSVYSSLTDAYGDYGDPTIMTEWIKNGVIVKTVRHPKLGSYTEDRKPCEHYTYPEPVVED